MAAGGRDNGPPGIRALYHPNYHANSCSIPMVITSKPCATPLRNRFPAGSEHSGIGTVIAQQ